jgi:hypothetical protein
MWSVVLSVLKEQGVHMPGQQLPQRVVECTGEEGSLLCLGENASGKLSQQSWVGDRDLLLTVCDSLSWSFAAVCVTYAGVRYHPFVDLLIE